MNDNRVARDDGYRDYLFRRVCAAVNSQTGVAVDGLVGKQPHHRARIRWGAWWLLYELGVSQVNIARYFGITSQSVSLGLRKFNQAWGHGDKWAVELRAKLLRWATGQEDPPPRDMVYESLVESIRRLEAERNLHFRKCRDIGRRYNKQRETLIDIEHVVREMPAGRHRDSLVALLELDGVE